MAAGQRQAAARDRLQLPVHGRGLPVLYDIISGYTYVIIVLYCIVLQSYSLAQYNLAQ